MSSSTSLDASLEDFLNQPVSTASTASSSEALSAPDNAHSQAPVSAQKQPFWWMKDDDDGDGKDDQGKGKKTASPIQSWLKQKPSPAKDTPAPKPLVVEVESDGEELPELPSMSHSLMATDGFSMADDSMALTQMQTNLKQDLSRLLASDQEDADESILKDLDAPDTLAQSQSAQDDKAQARQSSSTEHGDDMSQILSNIDYIESSLILSRSDIEDETEATTLSSHDVTTSAADGKPTTNADIAQENTQPSVALNQKATTSEALQTSKESILKRTNSRLQSATASQSGSRTGSSASSRKSKSQPSRQPLSRPIGSYTPKPATMDENRILMAEVEDLRAQLQSRQEMISNLQSKLEQRNPALDQERERILRGYQLENERMANEIRELRTRIKTPPTDDRERLLRELQIENSSLQDQVKTLQERDRLLASSRATEVRTLEELERTVRELEVENASLKELAERNRANSSPSKHATATTTTAPDVERLLAGYQKENEKLTAENKALQQDAKEHKQQLLKTKTQYEQEVLALKDELDRTRQNSLLSELQACRSQLDAERDLRAKADRQVSESSEKLQFMDRQLQQLNAKLAEAEKENQTLDEKLQQNNDEEHLDMAEFTVRLSALKEDHQAVVAGYQKRIESLEQELNSVEQERMYRADSFESISSAGQQEANSLRKELTDARAQIVQLQQRGKDDSAVESLRQQLDEARLELDRTKASITNADNDIERHRNAEMELSRLRFEHKQELEQLQQQISALESSNAIAQQQIQNYRDEILRLQNDLHSASTQLQDGEKRTKEVQSLQSRITELTEKVQLSEQLRQDTYNHFTRLLETTQTSTIALSLQQHQKALKILRDETLATANVVGNEEIKRLRDRVDACESLIALWQSQAQAWEAKCRQASDQADAVTNVLGQYRAAVTRWARQLDVVAPGENFADIFAQLDHAVETLLAENSTLKDEVVSMRRGEAPDIRHFRDLVDRIRELEHRFGQREQEWQEITNKQRQSSQEEVREMKLKYRALLQAKDDEIRRFKQELDGLLGSIDVLRQTGVMM